MTTHVIKTHPCKAGSWSINYVAYDLTPEAKFWVIDTDSSKQWVSDIKFCPVCSERLLPKNIKAITNYVEEE